MIKYFVNLYKEHKETSHNFFWRCIQTFGKQGVILIIFTISAKVLGLYDFGVYNYVMNFIFFLTMFADFGISTATSKFVAEYNLTNKDKLKQVLFNSGLIILSVSLLITILNILFGHYFLKDKSIYVFYLTPLLFLIPMVSLYDGIYRGLKRFKYLAISSSTIGCFFIVLAYPIIKFYGLIGALIFQNIFYGILFLVFAFGYKDFNFKFNKLVIKEIGSYSLVYGLAIAGNYLFIRFGVLILGYYGYIKELATYELLNKIFLIFVIPFTMLGQVVAPNFTEMSIRKEYLKIYSKLKKYTVYFSVVGVILGCFMYLIVPSIIQMFFNNYYNEIFIQILPFSIIILVSNICAATIDAGILIPSGFAGVMSKFYITLGIITSVFSWILVKNIGYIGVIYSFTFANVVMLFGMRFLLFIKLKNKFS